MTKKEQILQNKSAAIFDLDGTLIDSMGIWFDIDRRFFKMYGMEVPENYNQKIAHMSFRDMAVLTKEEYGIPESVDAIMKTWNDWAVDAYQNHILAKPGAKEFIQELKEKGFSLSVATSNREELYKPCLIRNGLFDYFDYALNVNDLGSTKSEPKIYNVLTEKMHKKPSETLVFEDIFVALNTAKKAGYTTVGVYDKANNPEMDKILTVSDYFLNSFNEIL